MKGGRIKKGWWGRGTRKREERVVVFEEGDCIMNGTGKRAEDGRNVYLREGGFQQVGWGVWVLCVEELQHTKGNTT